MSCNSGDPGRMTRVPMWRRVFATIATGGALMLAGCAAQLPKVERPPETALTAPADAPLMRAARQAAPPPESGRSGVWPLMQGSYALDARLAMIEQAQRSIDVQSYLVADDSTGRPILRALRDAARRGVRVRLLLDDLYTVDLDRLLLGLAAEPNVEVRLFNPFVTARASSGRRLLALGLDFGRLNHRMHNKLFLVDGAFAIIGGRNLADEYFLRGAQNNFIDFDVILAGPSVAELSGWFDVYWNHPFVHPVDEVVRAAGEFVPPAALARQSFDAATRDDPRPDPPMAPDFFGVLPFSAGLARHDLHFLPAEVSTYADSPNKIDPANFSVPVDDTLTHRFLQMLGDAHREAFLFSPYFVPGREALQRIAQLRHDGVAVRVVTNTLAVSDEPLVNVRLERHQRELLKMGVELYELSSNRLKLDTTLKGLLGTSTGRLHAKIAFLDRREVMVGSMNLDPRSARINTEVGAYITSPRLAEIVLGAFKVDAMAGVYQVKLRPDDAGVQWFAVDADKPEQLDIDPDTSLWQRIRLTILSLLVPESQL